MNEHSTPKAPFKSLGAQLRSLREQYDESTADLSGAVEVNESELLRMEHGYERPSEEVLLLMISHFDLEEHEAVQLWQLAGYDGVPEQMGLSEGRSSDNEVSPLTQGRPVVMLALDARVIYSDGFSVACHKTGVTLNFTQQSDSSQPNTISRLGMSYDQAEQVMRDIQQALLAAKYVKGPKLLPPGNSV